MKKIIVAILLLSGIAMYSADTGRDQRPAFDKSSYRKTVWTQVNPWFSPGKPRIHALGGPNYAWKSNEEWADAMAECVHYGITGWQVEIHEPGGGWMKTFKTMLKKAKDSNSSIQLALFVGFFSKDPRKSARALIRILGEIKEELKTHPNLYRLNDAPVLIVHIPTVYKPDEWKIITSEVEKIYGRFIWLANVRGLGNAENIQERLRAYLPYFDGIGNYGGAGVEDQKLRTEKIVPVMHKEFPQKIYEAGVHTTYTTHFHMGGLKVDLSRNYRESFDIALNAGPDSISITNLFDHYENSLILPCYERQDLLMRYAQYRITRWRNKPFPKIHSPELVLTNDITILPGRRDLQYEVLGFPFEAENTDLSVSVELCDSAGKVLKRFPFRKMTLSNSLHVERFTTSSMEFIGERSIHPRLVYTWRGREYKMIWNPMTLISPSIRSYWMYWARSTRNSLSLRHENENWKLGGKSIGETLRYPSDGIEDFSSDLKINWNPGWNTGYKQHSILRNGMILYSMTDPTILAKNLVLNLPVPNGALNYYQLEIENGNGCRYQTLPIWVSDNSRPGKVKIPFPASDKSIEEHEIEAARVPYYYYKCDRDAGPVLIDSSGYMHNGSINGTGYGGGHLGHTNYYYYHNGPVPSNNNHCFRTDENGRGMLTFRGKDFIMIMGNTAFPGASTYEASVRPAALGKRMGIFGSANNQINVCILEDGRVKASRGTEVEADGGIKPKKRSVLEVVSRTGLEAGKWSHIAVVYDLKHLTLYVNHRKEGEVESPPSRGHETITHLTVGALCKWLWTPVDYFAGDLREIRIYGRNLNPEEFLPCLPVPLIWKKHDA